MSSSPYLAVTAAAAALSSAAVGGLFYAFSTFVMAGLDRTAPAEALTAMRGINAQAQASGPLLILLVGSTVLAVSVGVLAAVRWSQPGSGFVVAGAGCSVLALVVTVAFNVPLNDHLADLDPVALSEHDALTEWHAYLGEWTTWNHVRTAAPLLGAALILLGVRGSAA